MEEFEKMVTVEELANHLGVDPEVIKRLVDKGSIIHYRIGKQVRFRLSEVEEFLKFIKAGRNIESDVR